MPEPDRSDRMRKEYRELDEAEKAAVKWFKETGADFVDFCEKCGPSREMEIAAQKMEEAVMWAVKHVTR